MSETTQVSSLPLPPMQYVSLFSDENVKRGRIPKPPPPITDSYSMFGSQFHTDGTGRTLWFETEKMSIILVVKISNAVIPLSELL